MQGARVWFLSRELDPTCFNEYEISCATTKTRYRQINICLKNNNFNFSKHSTENHRKCQGEYIYIHTYVYTHMVQNNSGISPPCSRCFQNSCTSQRVLPPWSKMCCGASAQAIEMPMLWISLMSWGASVDHRYEGWASCSHTSNRARSQRPGSGPHWTNY